jgi:hypothetical protein
MTLLAYDTLLGGATQAEKLSQIERTVEHNRVVDEQALALLRSMGTGTEAANATAKGAVGLSKRPTDRELTDAIDGLFEGLDEGTPSSVDQTAGKPVVPVQAAAVKGDLIEAAKEQPAGEQQKADGKADSK